MSDLRVGISWSRVALEGAVIVVSILLAFAIDAWWGGRLDRRSELTLMLSLAGDLEQAQVDIETALSRNGRIATTLGEFMAADPLALTGLPEDSAQVMLDNLLRFDTYAPTGGTLRSGAVENLSNRGPREALATWFAREATVTERTAIMLDLLKDLRLTVTPETLRALGDPGIDGGLEGASESLAWMRRSDEVVVTLLTLDSFAGAYQQQLRELSAQTDSALVRLRREITR